MKVVTAEPTIRLVSTHPGECGRCRRRIVVRAGVAGYVGDDARCVPCMLQDAPAIGWALALLEEVELTVRGKWPKTPTGRQLEPVFEVLYALRGAFKKRRRRNPGKIALRELEERLEDARAFLRELERLLYDARGQLREPVRDAVEAVDAFTFA